MLTAQIFPIRVTRTRPDEIDKDAHIGSVHLTISDAAITESETTPLGFQIPERWLSVAEDGVCLPIPERR